MRLQSSNSEPVAWRDNEPAELGDSEPRDLRTPRRTKTQARNLRRSRAGSLVITGALFVIAGAAAAGLLFSDRLGELWLPKNWTEPSAAWMALFNDKSGATLVRAAKMESAVLITPATTPLPHEQPRRADGEVPVKVAKTYPGTAAVPMTTASVSGAPAGVRDLQWLPEAEKRAEPVEPTTAATLPPPATPALPAARVAVTAPDVAPIALPGAPPPASLPVAADVADLIKRSKSHIERGDIAGARLLLQRAASASEPSALMALAETYDPAMLAKWGARGLKADSAKARALYQKAAESGLAEARARVLAVR